MAECKGCEKNVTCVERRFFGGNQKNCKDFQKKTHYTLEELAKRMCKNLVEASEDACWDGSCPAADYCHVGHNGMLEWLREVVEE